MRKRAFFRLPASLFSSLGLAACGLIASCYSTSRGISPPAAAPYYPVGLATSPGGKVLYLANSDFDLQYEAGTLESYDLDKIRTDALLLRSDPRSLESRCADAASNDCPYITVPRETDPRCADAPGDTRTTAPDPDGAVTSVCAPPMKPIAYHKATVRIGAFATDLELSRSGFTRGGVRMRRLFAPVRGNGSVTWADIADDVQDPNADASVIGCGADQNEGTCDIGHQAGNREDEPNNSRRLTLPGEPFGMAQSIDGTFLGVSHQSTGQASLLSSGLPAVGNETQDATTPSIQFITDNVPSGGNGIASIPYDPDSFVNASSIPRPAFLLSSSTASQLTLLRLFDDQGLSVDQGGRSTLVRPYLVPEARYEVDASPSGLDSRDILIDPTPRIQCKNRLGAGATQEQIRACARLPIRVYLANRSPASVLVAELGEREDTTIDGGYAADSLRFIGAEAMPSGISRMRLAPIVDVDGVYTLRLFVVCFDSSAVVVMDPATMGSGINSLDHIIRVGRGPFALAFDPFDFDAVVRHDPVAKDAAGNYTYRFGYVASFTESYLQVLDLDRSGGQNPTFEHVVFTLGTPTPPLSEKKN